MNIEISLSIFTTGLLVLTTHPMQSPKIKDFEGQFLYLKAIELGLISYAFGVFTMLIFQRLAQFVVQNHYGAGALWGTFSAIQKAESGSEESFFWSITTRLFPILVGWAWSRGALYVFTSANKFWQKKVGNPIMKLLLYYHLAKEFSINRQILDSMIDETPLLFFLKSGDVYVGVPTLIEICSGSAKTPFKEITIFPLLARPKSAFSQERAPKNRANAFSTIEENEVFLSYEAIERVCICTI